MACSNSRKAANQGKHQYDKKVRTVELVTGDRVLVRNLTPRGGPGKICSFWEQGIYPVVDKKGDTPVYEVAPESGKGKNRIIHRIMIKQCNELPVETLTRNVQMHQDPLINRSCCDRPPTPCPKELIDDELESEEEEVLSLFPNDLKQVRPSQHNHKQTVENFQCEGAETARPSFSVATLDLRFLPTAQAISTYFHLRMSALILPTTPYIENIPMFLPTLRLFFKNNI